jgi:predicted DNA-binding protein (MmcQ/YjbR family)
MDIEQLRAFCLAKPFVEECLPFGDDTLVFKVGGKIFLLTGLDVYDSFNIKCDPEKAIALRETYAGIIPGYHMNKKHWNTVKVFEDVPQALMYEMIEESYNLVLNSLPKKVRQNIENV